MSRGGRGAVLPPAATNETMGTPGYRAMRDAVQRLHTAGGR